ncbi:class I SAM-dependent methyltransferase [Paenibacillus riograndensis]|uniref:class I SAM-dependent methyltransferase n=1 Tax=Paenibacillus riograndensis TaxID=483937 RepID=UPI000764863E|nr:class I SAM-dependent methyltransferase [Paenibacillus riograndensis]
MIKEGELEKYWEQQAVEGKRWQEKRYRNNGMVWGTEAGPTVEYAKNFFGEHKFKRILVVGCGYGRECIYFADNGYQVTGIDFSDEGIKLAKKWLEEQDRNIIFEQGDALHLNFQDKSFDAVFTHKVFHQFRNSERTQMMREIHRVLKIGGGFFLSDLSTSDSEFGVGTEIEHNMFEREKRPFRPLYFIAKEHLEEFQIFSSIRTEELEYWETHPGENCEHKHAFMLVSGLKQ